MPRGCSRLTVVAVIAVYSNIIFHLWPIQISLHDFQHSATAELPRHVGIVYWLPDYLPHFLWHIYSPIPIQNPIFNHITLIDVLFIAVFFAKIMILFGMHGTLFKILFLFRTQQRYYQCSCIDLFQTVMVYFHSSYF